MSADAAQSLTFEMLSRILRDVGVERVLFKQLAPNDNSKNQIYLGGELSILNVLPSGDLLEEVSSSEKPGASGKQRLKAPVPLFWLDAEGHVHPAPHAQLILYPQYPEVRLSGFLQGSSVGTGQWFDPTKHGRSLGRVLLLGVAKDGKVYGYLALPDSPVAKQTQAQRTLASFGALTELVFIDDDGTSDLLRELRRISALEWIVSKRLDAIRGIVSCDSPNCGGYTLEAELGVKPNGLAEPDFRGWEVKTFSVTDFRKLDAKIITLMTPEPDGGLYKDIGVEAFIRRFGYADVGGRVDRFNVGGIYKCGRENQRTGLRLDLLAFDEASGKIKDVNGGIALFANGDCAALWTYRKLLEHWKKKHDKAVYVPNICRVGPPRMYHYGNKVLMGRGGEFERLLRAVRDGRVYYDPGIKLENASSNKPRTKRRSQFRIKSGGLGALYRTFDHVTV